MRVDHVKLKPSRVKRPKAGQRYIFDPCREDALEWPDPLEEGDIVRVVDMPEYGAPGEDGWCYVERVRDRAWGGMVRVQSLHAIKKGE